MKSQTNEVVQVAIEYAKGLLMNDSDIRVEEIIPTGSIWSITISLNQYRPGTWPFNQDRVYKIVEVNDETREALNILMWPRKEEKSIPDVQPLEEEVTFTEKQVEAIKNVYDGISGCPTYHDAQKHLSGWLDFHTKD